MQYEFFSVEDVFSIALGVFGLFLAVWWVWENRVRIRRNFNGDWE